MVDTSQAVGVVKSIRGEVFANGADGRKRLLAVGDKIYEGDIIVCAEGGGVDIQMPSKLVQLGEEDVLVVERQFGEASLQDDALSAVPALTPAEVAKVIADIRANDPNWLLEQEPTAAGPVEEDSGGTSFVRLERIAEDVPASHFSSPEIIPGAVTAIAMPGQIPVQESNQHFVGTQGNDVIVGSSGNDLIQGGAGNDVLTGGLGADVFRWQLVDVPAGTTTDKITDFAPGDSLDVRDLFTQDNTSLIIDNAADTVTMTWSALDGLHAQVIEFTFDSASNQQHLIEANGVIKIG